MNTGSPASIYKYLSDHADLQLTSAHQRSNLDIIMDIHWFFLHSKYHKKKYSLKNHKGKWKHDACSDTDLIIKAGRLVPLVAEGNLPVVKFTNPANVFTGERQLVVYCFPFGLHPEMIRKSVMKHAAIDFYWASKKYSIEKEG